MCKYFLPIFVTLTSIAIFSPLRAEESEASYAPWRIVSAADWHSAEGGVTSPNPSVFERCQENERRLIQGTVALKPDVVLIAGDVGSGHWTMGQLQRARVLNPSETIQQAITRLGTKTYRSMKKNFAAAGVDRLLLCPGDHGLGDNDWPPGSERARCVPFHREVFGKSFNTDEQGRWLWPATVCGVPSRPLGTKYENTSFAVRHKNVLFVMVDVFHQEGPNDRLHPRHGSISPEVVGKHLQWLDTVLAAGRHDKSIRYIFVQGHTPILPPVRAKSSSMMMAAGYTKSNLWQVMQRHHVDLYFAGEVHATTVSKTPESDLVQLVTDRNMPTLLTIYDDKIELQCFNRSREPDGSIRANPLYPQHRLTISKADGKTILIGGQGVLKPLDTSALFLHYAFDSQIPKNSGSVVPRIENHGELNYVYDGLARHARSVDGKLGRGVALDRGGTIDSPGMGPFGLFDCSQRTFALWFKTDDAGCYNLVCGGSGRQGRARGETGWMDLGIDKGSLFVKTSAGKLPVAGPKLNDGNWHHAALVVTPDAKKVVELRVYVDGKYVPWSSAVDSQAPVSTRMAISGISLGGSHRPVWSKGTRNSKIPSFQGSIDDFAAWYRALGDREIEILVRLGREQSMNASQVDRLLRSNNTKYQL